VNDQVRQQFNDQSQSNNPNQASTGLISLTQLVDSSSHQLSGLEEIEFKSKIFYPLMNKKQRVLFDSCVPFIVTSSLFTIPKAYPNTLTPSLHHSINA
jgi:hypothetical protein